MARSFEHEALAYALDGDTVQNLLALVFATMPAMTEEDAMAELRAMLERDLLRVYEDDEEGGSTDLAPGTLTIDRVRARHNTWMEATPETLRRYSVLSLASNGS